MFHPEVLAHPRLRARLAAGTVMCRYDSHEHKIPTMIGRREITLAAGTTVTIARAEPELAIAGGAPVRTSPSKPISGALSITTRRSSNKSRTCSRTRRPFVGMARVKSRHEGGDS